MSSHHLARLASLHLALGLVACGDNVGPPALPEGARTTFAVLEVTDLHSNILGYDYFKLAQDKTIGLERTATLIRQARAELPGSLLADDGDAIQGTVLADYQASVAKLPCSQPLAVYKAMNALGFDVGGIGNHEFNYGLGYLAQVTHTAFDVDGVDTGSAATCAGPAFPQVLANVFSAKTNAPLFQPHVIIAKPIEVVAPSGARTQGTLRIGAFAFAPPPIVAWDKRWLDGKVYTKGVREVAAQAVADLRAQGADLVVAIMHGGLDDAPYTPDLENQGWYLAQVPGIDALLLGHSHLVFPDAASSAAQFNLPMVDKAAGRVAGVPTTMAGSWGQDLGVISLGLVVHQGAWTVDPSQTVVEARPITTTCTGGLPSACRSGMWATGAACPFAGACQGLADGARVSVDADPTIAPLVAEEHDGTIAYVKTPIGSTDFEMSTLFAEVGDATAIQVVNQAQADYVASYIQDNLPQYQSLPVVSVSAPFKSGRQGGTDYTDVATGAIAINNAADLYLFANTVYAVKVTGAGLIDWLEAAATRFARIDPAQTADQPLINPNQPGFNFDVITDPRLSYEIDLTQPLPAPGQKAAGRIKNLTFNEAPLDPAAEFIVATNNYRASGGGGFPGLDGSKTIYASPETNRDVLIRYIQGKGMTPGLTRAANGSARSWRFTRVSTAGRVVFSSGQNALARAQAAGITNVSLIQQDDGTGKQQSLYAVDLSQ